ncbi:hypothetical protein F2Q69_00051221 [Brassica cretica]|uniref:Uncharacterized protein n=1 Tax=Brassica cretica TaxID=69181 RepID=A0A8S9PV58_BRACR|nr:hypothetical protein F2Q69_00051221 [Brassica cretica]
MSRRNRVEQVITTGCNPEKRSKEHQSGVTTIGVKVKLSDKNWNSQAKGEICRLGRVGTSCLNKSGFRFSYSLRKLSWVRVLTRGELDIYNLIQGGVSHLLEDVLIGSAEGVKVSVSNMVSSREKELKGKRTTKSEPSMMQGNTCLSILGRVRLVLHKQAHLKLKEILRQCPQESPLANGQILIDGQVLIRLMVGSMTNRRVQVVDGDAHVLVLGDILIQEGLSQGCVESLSNSDDWMAAPVQSSSVFKEFDSRLSAHEWNRKAKEEINLQKDVQFSVQAFEHVRDFDSNVVLLISSRGVTRYEVTRRQWELSLTLGV